MNIILQSDGFVIKTCDGRAYYVDDFKSVPEARHIYQGVLSHIASNRVMNIYHNFQHKAMLDFGDENNCSIFRMELNPAILGEDGKYRQHEKDKWIYDDQPIGKSWKRFIATRSEERKIPYSE